MSDGKIYFETRCPLNASYIIQGGKWEIIQDILNLSTSEFDRIYDEMEFALYGPRIPVRKGKTLTNSEAMTTLLLWSELKKERIQRSKCGIERDSKDDDCGHLNKVPLPSKDTKKEGID